MSGWLKICLLYIIFPSFDWLDRGPCFPHCSSPIQPPLHVRYACWTVIYVSLIFLSTVFDISNWWDFSIWIVTHFSLYVGLHDLNYRWFFFADQTFFFFSFHRPWMRVRACVRRWKAACTTATSSGYVFPISASNAPALIIILHPVTQPVKQDYWKCASDGSPHQRGAGCATRPDEEHPPLYLFTIGWRLLLDVALNVGWWQGKLSISPFLSAISTLFYMFYPMFTTFFFPFALS